MSNPPSLKLRRTRVIKGARAPAWHRVMRRVNPTPLLVAWALGMMYLATGLGSAGVSSIEVSPLTMELRIDPGRTYTGTINLANTGQESEHIRVFCQDWTLKPDGVVVFVAAGRLPSSASGWVQVTPNEFDVAAGKAQAVRYTVRIPEDASGESRTVILFEANPQQISIKGAPSTLVPRVGTILYVQVRAPPAIQARVADFELGPEGGFLVVENQGAGHLRFTGRYEIRSANKLVSSGDLNGFVVLPAPFNLRRMSIPKEMLAGLAAGEYEVTVLLDCGGPSLLGARKTVALAPEPPSVTVARQ